MNYSQKANPNATNSELDAKVIIDHNDDSRFIEQIYELAFGDDAINRNFSHDEVIEQIREFSDHALEWEESGLELEQLYNISEEIEKSYRQGYVDGKNSMNPTFHMDQAFNKAYKEV